MPTMAKIRVRTSSRAQASIGLHVSIGELLRRCIWMPDRRGEKMSWGSGGSNTQSRAYRWLPSPAKQRQGGWRTQAFGGMRAIPGEGEWCGVPSQLYVLYWAWRVCVCVDINFGCTPLDINNTGLRDLSTIWTTAPDEGRKCWKSKQTSLHADFCFFPSHVSKRNVPPHLAYSMQQRGSCYLSLTNARTNVGRMLCRRHGLCSSATRHERFVIQKQRHYLLATATL
jgi:hypothetical protein